MNTIFVSEHHRKDLAVTLKEECSSRYNLGWICRRHGWLDLKGPGRRGLTRHLISEIAQQGGNFKKEHGYKSSKSGYTHCMGGTGYQGGAPFGTIDDALRYLKKYFVLKACKGNNTFTQSYLNRLLGKSMNIPLIRIWELADLLEKEGQKRILPKNDKLGVEIYEDNDASITILIPGIIRRPSVGIESSDDFFKELQKEIEHYLPKIKTLVFQEGGNIPIPDWFLNWCRDNGVVVKWVGNELMKRSLSPETLKTFEDIIDGL